MKQVGEMLGAKGPEVIRVEGWEASQRLFPLQAKMLLEPARIRAFCRRIEVSNEMEEALLETLPFFEKDTLARLLWHFHYLLFLDPGFPAERVDSWPRFPREIHPSSILFYALVFLSGIPHTQRLYKARGISADRTEDTLRRFGQMLDSSWRSGREADVIRCWTVYALVGRLFRLGRLEFLFDTFAFDYHVFRHRDDGRVIVLAGDGMRFRGDGQFDGANGIHDEKAGWTAVFAADSGVIVGSPISPFGRAVRREIRLDPRDWEKVLQKGDRTVSVHIPASGPMTPEACRDAFAEAARFFPAHFPDKPFAAFTCCSWLMDPQFEQVLPPESNIVRFLQEYYLIPLPGAGDRAVFQWIFQGKPEDLATAPRATTLQRAILDHIAGGGHWRNAGGIFLADGRGFGDQVYRRMHVGAGWAGPLMD